MMRRGSGITFGCTLTLLACGDADGSHSSDAGSGEQATDSGGGGAGSSSDGDGGGDGETGTSGAGGSDSSSDNGTGSSNDSGSSNQTGSGSDSGSDSSSDSGTSTGGLLEFVAVTFNTGTNKDLDHDSDNDDYGNDEADISDEYYGDGLAWQASVDGVRDFLADLQPDVIVFQEMFYSPECDGIPPDKKAGFVCETWQPGDPTVAQVVLGDGYQVVCHLGKNDKCAGIKRSFGTFVGCADDLCMDFLDGVGIENCGGGSRVGRGLIELTQGGTLTLVSYHGTSGLLPADQSCRIKQIEQIFLDFDGQPAANGLTNLIMGDLNTDPYRAIIDLSAARWLDFVGDGRDFHFISDAGPSAPPTYDNLLNIDHVISDVLEGDCVAPGVGNEPPVLETVYFDHKPIVCSVREP